MDYKNIIVKKAWIDNEDGNAKEQLIQLVTNEILHQNPKSTVGSVKPIIQEAIDKCMLLGGAV